MKKNSTVLAIAAAYIGTALIALYIAFQLDTDFLLIIGLYLICALVASAVLIFVFATRKKREDIKEKERLYSLIQNITAMAIIWDADFHYVKVNDVLTATTGYTEEDLQDNPKNLRKLLPEDAFAPSLQAIINNRDEEFYVTAKGGAKVCTIWNTSMMSVVNGKRGSRYLLMSIGLDLSENARIKNELIKYSEKLSASEARLSLSMELSEIGLMLKEAGSYNYYLSEQLRKMIGKTEEYLTAAEIRELVHPNDLITFDSIHSMMTNPNGQAETPTNEAEMRIMMADSTYHWIQYRYKLTPADNIIDARAGGAVIDITKVKERDKLIEKMAYIDEVTEIYNRNKFMLMGQEIYECSAGSFDSGLNYWIIVLDIDDFHIINDTCGYINGNKLLKDTAGVIMSTLTSGGFGARIGGDNFAILIKDTGDDNLPINIIEKIQEGMAEFSTDKFANQRITCSAGYCKMSDGGDDFSQVLDRAEFSLSLSGDTKGGITRYDIKIHDKIIETNLIEKELTQAIDNNEFVLYYQPKINLSDGSLMGMEALIRWVKPDGTVVPPGSFIQVAENSLLITKISQFVLDEACRQNKAWQDMGYPPITVSINLTAIDFYQTNVTDSIKKALEVSGMDAQWLDVELTESLALKDIDHAVHQMEEIRSLGVKLSMDDFGTGYSSLSYIQILPITLLKLDRSFVMYLEEDEISREIVSAVIRIAKSKKIETIAEGIETPGQAQILKQSGCDHAQGYFFGKPMPADEFEKFMAMKSGVKITKE